jgi:hypothetical protein
MIGHTCEKDFHMPIFFAKIEKKLEHYDFIDPVLLVHSKFPILPICKKPLYFFIFSDSYFPESEHVFKKVDNILMKLYTFF